MPLFVLPLCYLTQSHVSLWLPCAFLAAQSLLLSLVNRRPTRKDFAWLAGGLFLALIIWLPPILQRKNLSLIFAFFFDAPGASHSWSDAFRALAVLTGESVSGAPLSYQDVKAEEWRFALGFILILAAFGATTIAWRTRSHFAAALGSLIIGSIGSSLRIAGYFHWGRVL